MWFEDHTPEYLFRDILAWLNARLTAPAVPHAPTVVVRTEADLSHAPVLEVPERITSVQAAVGDDTAKPADVGVEDAHVQEAVHVVSIDGAAST